MPQDLVVLTPEKAIVNFPLANLGARAGAHFVDGLVIMACVTSMNFASVALSLSGGTAIRVVISVLAVMFPFAYFILFEGLWNGQTPGKKASSLRVRKSDGSPITISAAATRNLLRVADFLPSLYLAGIVTMFLNTKAQRIGDLAADTIVVHEPKLLPFFTPTAYVLGHHACEEYIPDLRSMTLEEYNALKKMCDRFPELPTQVQNKLVQDLWRPVALRLHIGDVANIHPIYMAEATVMKYGRENGLL